MTKQITITLNNILYERLEQKRNKKKISRSEYIEGLLIEDFSKQNDNHNNP